MRCAPQWVHMPLPPSLQDRVLSRVLNARQFGLKMIANVSYGYTAAGFSGRLPFAELADSIVQSGRQTLENAIRLVGGWVGGSAAALGGAGAGGGAGTGGMPCCWCGEVAVAEGVTEAGGGEMRARGTAHSVTRIPCR